MHSAGNPSIANTGRLELLTQAASRLMIALLAVFHAGLLVVHAIDGRLFQPATSVRWIVGGLLFAGFVALRRLNVPLFWGRKAVVLWLLVVLLHCHAAFSSADTDGRPTFDPMVATLVTQVLVATVTLIAAMVATIGRRDIEAPRAHWHALTVGPSRVVTAAGFSSAFSARPPPAC